MIRKLAAHLVMTRTDAGTDRGDDIARARPVSRCQRANRDHRCASGSALPSCMHRRDGAGSAIGHENRNAIGRSDADSSERIVCHGDISLRPLVKPDPACFFHDKHVGAVNLTETRQRIELHSKRLRQHVPTLRIRLTDAFERELAGAEAVPGDLGERTAPQRGAPRLLHPLEVAARLWKRHGDQYYRSGPGCDRNRPH